MNEEGTRHKAQGRSGKTGKMMNYKKEGDENGIGIM